MPKEKRGGFGANKFARNPAALFLPAQSVISRSYFGFELRARADSPLPRHFARLRGRGDLRSLWWWRGARRCRGKDPESAAEDKSVNCLALARRLASPAPYGLATLRLGYPRLRSAHFAPRWTRRFPRPPTPLSLQAACEEGRSGEGGGDAPDRRAGLQGELRSPQEALRDVRSRSKRMRRLFPPPHPFRF